jgi:hypothetical protein
MIGCDIIWAADYCYKCKTGFVLKNNMCVPSMSVTSFSGGKCTSNSDCKSSYTCDISSGTCRPDNCSAFHDDHPSKCKTCNTNYQLIDLNGTCENKLKNCDVPDLSTEGSCSTCSSGFSKNRYNI